MRQRQGHGYGRYQRAFAKTLAEMGSDTPPSGPAWLEPEVLSAKEACMSCHLSIDDNRFLYARQPYRRHSGHYLEDHPKERFGCTVCHRGVAGALDFAGAGHAPPGDPSRRELWQRDFGWQAPGTEGMVPLRWIGGRCVLCHPGTDAQHSSSSYREGRSMAAEKRCTACHSFADEPVPLVRRALRLDNLGSKVKAAWLEAYLRAPDAFWPSTAMPTFRLEDDEVRTMAGYLLSRRDPRIPWDGDDPAEDSAAVERGKRIVEERRCQTCHDIPGVEESGFLAHHKIGPSLARAGEKLNPVWIGSWLSDPHAIQPDTAMPRFRWTDGEIADVTAFLCSLREQGARARAPAREPDNVSAAEATAVALKYACGSCHSLGGLDLAPTAKTDLSRVGPEILARLAKNGPSLDELDRKVLHRSTRAPRLLTGRDSAVLAFLARQAKPAIAGSFRSGDREGQPPYDPGGPAGKLVRELRCRSCHTIRGHGGDIGPDLSYAGSKLQRTWLVSFLQSPDSIRPMNRARMPRLGLSAREAGILADWILTDLESDEVERSKPDLESAFSFVGESNFKSPLGCITCHRIGPEGGRIGPDLTHVGSRLEVKWIYNWIKNPKHWVPDTRMPVFEMQDDDRLAVTLYLSEQK